MNIETMSIQEIAVHLREREATYVLAWIQPQNKADHLVNGFACWGQPLLQLALIESINLLGKAHATEALIRGIYNPEKES